MRTKIGSLVVAISLFVTACVKTHTQARLAAPPPPPPPPPPAQEANVPDHAFNEVIKNLPGTSGGTQPITTALPLADYYVCRLTPQQSRIFTHHPPPAGAAPDPMAASNAANKVGCSQSLMTWNETRHMFGRAIADNYLAIQVNVRNLDADNEFLLHDSQIAFRNNNDPLFAGGRDRVLARGLQQNTNWDSRRNLSVMLATAIGSVGVAATAVTGGMSLQNAFSVFNGTFVPFLDGKVPDLSIAQLRMMDDMVYSSANAYHIVVPTKGTVPFVTFVPLDVYIPNVEAFKKQKDQAELYKIADSMYVIVAGVHIAQVNPAVGLTAFTCPLTAAGNLDVTQTPFVCQVTGTSLNQVAKIRLHNSANSSDTVVADGALSVDGGSTTSGKATFNVADLKKLIGSQYNAFVVLPNGQETSTSLTVSVAAAAATTATSVDTASLKLSTCTTKCVIQLAGQNLDKLDAAVTLKNGTTAISGAAVDAGGSATARTVSFASPTPALDTSATPVLTLTAGGVAVKVPAVTVAP